MERETGGAGDRYRWAGSMRVTISDMSPRPAVPDLVSVSQQVCAGGHVSRPRRKSGRRSCECADSRQTLQSAIYVQSEAHVQISSC